MKKLVIVLAVLTYLLNFDFPGHEFRVILPEENTASQMIQNN